jgi:hypothetical protein
MKMSAAPQMMSRKESTHARSVERFEKVVLAMQVQTDEMVREASNEVMEGKIAKQSI